MQKRVLNEIPESVLSQWPVSRPRQWRIRVNQTRTEAEVYGMRRNVNQCAPFDDSDWIKRIVERLSLDVTDRPRSRPILTTGACSRLW